MPHAMVALQNITLSGAASSVTFSNIPSNGFKDLRLIYVVSSANGNQDVGVQFNGSNGNSYVYMAGFGSSTGSGNVASSTLGFVNSAGLINYTDIFDYASTDKHKSGLQRYGSSAVFSASSAFRWPSNDAISSIRIYVGSGTFAAGSTFTLYGIVG